MEVTKEFSYKDFNRDEWKIILFDTGMVDEEGEFRDKIWRYSIAREDNCGFFKEFYAEQITGQSDEVPNLLDILEDFQHHMNCLTLNFAKYGKPIDL